MSSEAIPALTIEQMREVDRLMTEEYGITRLQIMENAGRHLAELTRRLLGGEISGKNITVLCGAGNNGGGGMVAARHLSNWGAAVQVVLARPVDELHEATALQWHTLGKLPLERVEYDEENPPDFNEATAIIDALLGYGLQGDPHGAKARLIEQANATGKMIVSLDVPSGLDATSGRPGTPCTRAAVTMALAVPKVGLLKEAARPYAGQLYMADISVPPVLYEQIGVENPRTFMVNSVMRVHDGNALLVTGMHRLESRFDPTLQHVLRLARSEARRVRSRFVGTGHLLVALLRSQTYAGKVLRSFYIDVKEARAIVNSRMERYQTTRLRWLLQPEMSSRPVHIIEQAAVQSEQMGDEQITAVHLLLALVEFDKGAASQIMQRYNITADEVRQRALSPTSPWSQPREMTGPPTAASPAPFEG